MMMLEKAAQALCLSRLNENAAVARDPTILAEQLEAFWRSYLPDVRAVLGAIREPDETAKEAGRSTMPDYCPDTEDAARVFRMIIDAILSEEPK